MALSNLPRISATNYVQAVPTLITASSAQANLPAKNVALQSPYNDYWQSLDTSPSLVFDFGRIVPIDDLVLVGLTLGSTDTVQHLLSDSIAGGSDVFDSGVIASNTVPGYDAHAYPFSFTRLARYWQINFSAPSLAAIGYVRCGGAWAGPSVCPEFGLAYGYSDQWTDSSKFDTSIFSGKRYPLPLPKRRQTKFAWNALAESEALDSVKEIQRIAGITGSVMFAPDPTSARLNKEVIIGLLDQLNPVAHADLPIWSWASSITQNL